MSDWLIVLFYKNNCVPSSSLQDRTGKFVCRISEIYPSPNDCFVIKFRILALAVLLIATHPCMTQQTIPLYTDKIPNSKDVPNEEETTRDGDIVSVSKISIPSITIFLPPKKLANSTAVIIFPGGGYWINAIEHEGFALARQFNEWGITAFVVKYRIPDERTMIEPSIGPLQDAQQAILRIRSEAARWGIDPKRIGIMGFSAGGHLASTLGTHYQESIIENPQHISLRPDFMMLIYPVISADTTIRHPGSFEKLLGKDASSEQLQFYSNELQVTDDTPPSFLVHASDDDVVPAANSVVFYEALLRHHVKAELHLYQEGGHGFGMKNPTTSDRWMDRCRNWLMTNGWMPKK